MISKTYQIQCEKCKGKSKLDISDNNQVSYIDQTPIISSRFRKDLAWGFECICGNDTRLCREELYNDEAKVKVRGSSKEVVTAVIDNMKQSSQDSFIMTEI